MYHSIVIHILTHWFLRGVGLVPSILGYGASTPSTTGAGPETRDGDNGTTTVGPQRWSEKSNRRSKWSKIRWKIKDHDNIWMLFFCLKQKLETWTFTWIPTAWVCWNTGQFHEHLWKFEAVLGVQSSSVPRGYSMLQRFLELDLFFSLQLTRIHIYIYVAGTFGVYFVPPHTNVIKRNSICIYTIYISKYVYMCVQVQQKIAIFSLAPQPAQRPFSAPRDAVTSTRERTPIWTLGRRVLQCQLCCFPSLRATKFWNAHASLELLCAHAWECFGCQEFVVVQLVACLVISIVL